MQRPDSVSRRLGFLGRSRVPEVSYLAKDRLVEGWGVAGRLTELEAAGACRRTAFQAVRPGFRQVRITLLAGRLEKPSYEPQTSIVTPVLSKVDWQDVPGSLLFEYRQVS